MKKLLLLATLLFSLATAADASPGCLFYWSPQTLFFQSGGSVTVRHTDGSFYTINLADVTPGAQYTLVAGDLVYVYPPTCAVWYWGWTYFCPCNSSGGVTCGAAQPMQVGGVVYTQFSVFENCNCPNGSSSAGLTYVFSKYCEQQPPPPQ